jgi:glycopeptide antibiotics resistance protein
LASSTLQRFLLILFGLLSLAALLAAPVAAGGSLRPFACDLGSSPDWLATIVNIRHLVSFGVLATLGFLALRGQPLWLPIAVLVGVTGGVEVTQAIFDSGHCRLRDLIPNLIAIGIGWAVAQVVRRLWSPQREPL